MGHLVVTEEDKNKAIKILEEYHDYPLLEIKRDRVYNASVQNIIDLIAWVIVKQRAEK